MYAVNVDVKVVRCDSGGGGGGEGVVVGREEEAEKDELAKFPMRS